MEYGIQLAGDVSLVFCFKAFFVLLLLKCPLSKSATDNHAAMVVFAELPSMLAAMSLSLPR